jgi:hypothetical protein
VTILVVSHSASFRGVLTNSSDVFEFLLYALYFQSFPYTQWADIYRHTTPEILFTPEFHTDIYQYMLYTFIFPSFLAVYPCFAFKKYTDTCTLPFRGLFISIFLWSSKFVCPSNGLKNVICAASERCYSYIYHHVSLHCTKLISPILSDGCETWSLYPYRRVLTMNVFTNRTMRMFGPMREEQVHAEKHHNFLRRRIIITVIKLKRMALAEHIVCIGG